MSEEPRAATLAMRRAPVGVVKAALVAGQVTLSRVRRSPTRAGLRILCYHRVSPARDQLAVTPARFRRQLDVIEGSGLPVVDVMRFARGETMPPSSIALTFDDGYADLLEHALPELARRRWPAIVFVVPEAVEGRVRFPWYRGHQPRVISWAEMIDVERDGLTRFEPHSLTHAPLSSLSAEGAWREIAGSRRAVSDALGREPEMFCYPGGYHGERETRFVERAGYTAAVSCEYGVNDRNQDRFALRRIPVDRYDRTWTMAGRLRGATDRPPPLRRPRSEAA
jgi:peptidoglycan/xylan/chitin deacetylase (PgdA/CDA1 family)